MIELQTLKEINDIDLKVSRFSEIMNSNKKVMLNLNEYQFFDIFGEIDLEYVSKTLSKKLIKCGFRIKTSNGKRGRIYKIRRSFNEDYIRQKRKEQKSN